MFKMFKTMKVMQMTHGLYEHLHVRRQLICTEYRFVSVLKHHHRNFLPQYEPEDESAAKTAQ